MVKGKPPREGSPQPAWTALQREAEAELRRAGALAGPAQAGAGPSHPPEGAAPHRASLPWVTPEEESRAITDLAMQQLAERAVPTVARRFRTGAPAESSAEELRSRALAEMLDRQQRLAREHPVAPNPKTTSPVSTVGARARAAPVLTAAPVATMGRPPGVPRDSGARAPKIRAPGETTERVGGPSRAKPSAWRPLRSPLRSPDATEFLERTPTSIPVATLAVVSASTLEAIAALLGAMELLPAPAMSEPGQAEVYVEIAEHMATLGGLLERFLLGEPGTPSR